MVLVGGNGPNEGNILVTGEGLVLGPLCDFYFGFDEVRCKRNFSENRCIIYIIRRPWLFART